MRAAARHHSISPSQNVELAVLPDIAQPIDWTPLLEEVDVVVHLAGIAHRKPGDPVDYDQANRGAVADLASACLKHKVRRLIFISSIGAQAGSAADEELTEECVPYPVNDYGRAKLAAEEAIRASGVPYVILRPVLVYGSEPIANIALLVRLAALPIPLPFGAFHNRRSLVSRENLISAVRWCIDQPGALNETFIVSDPQPMSLAETLAVLRRAMGRRPNLLPIPPAIFFLLAKAARKTLLWDRIGRELVASSDKLQSRGWKPLLTTEEGLTAMVQGTGRPKLPAA